MDKQPTENREHRRRQQPRGARPRMRAEVSEQKLGTGLALGSTIGVAVGAGFGVAFGNVALGAGFGLCLGTGVGLIAGSVLGRRHARMARHASHADDGRNT